MSNSILLRRIKEESLGRQRLEKALARATNQNKLILDSAGEGIYGVDAEGKTTFANPATEKMIGYRVQEILGKPLHSMIHHSKSDGTAYPGQECPIHAAFKDGKVHQVAEEVFWRKDGSCFPVEYMSTPILENGVPVGAVVTFKDISERKRKEEELKNYRNHLEELVTQRTAGLNKALDELKNMNELKNKFLGIAAHDLRNPLYLIRSFSEALIDGSLGGINEKQLNFLKKIFDSSEFMKDLLNNLLDISKIESGKMDLDLKVQDINGILQNQVELNQFLGGKKSIKLRFKPGDVPPVSFDKNTIVQVINNYIGNAIKYSPPGSEIIISTKSNSNNVRVSVKDEGPGISEDDQKLLFGEFQTLTSKPTGGEKATGLGLAIVKKIIARHRGEVGVSSKLGKGSEFFFTLPHSSSMLK